MSASDRADEKKGSSNKITKKLKELAVTQRGQWITEVPQVFVAHDFKDDVDLGKFTFCSDISENLIQMASSSFQRVYRLVNKVPFGSQLKIKEIQEFSVGGEKYEGIAPILLRAGFNRFGCLACHYHSHSASLLIWEDKDKEIALTRRIEILLGDKFRIKYSQLTFSPNGDNVLVFLSDGFTKNYNINRLYVLDAKNLQLKKHLSIDCLDPVFLSESSFICKTRTRVGITQTITQTLYKIKSGWVTGLGVSSPISIPDELKTAKKVFKPRNLNVLLAGKDDYEFIFELNDGLVSNQKPEIRKIPPDLKFIGSFADDFLLYHNQKGNFVIYNPVATEELTEGYHVIPMHFEIGNSDKLFPLSNGMVLCLTETGLQCCKLLEKRQSVEAKENKSEKSVDNMVATHLGSQAASIVMEYLGMFKPAQVDRLPLIEAVDKACTDLSSEEMEVMKTFTSLLEKYPNISHNEAFSAACDKCKFNLESSPKLKEFYLLNIVRPDAADFKSNSL